VVSQATTHYLVCSGKQQQAEVLYRHSQKCTGKNSTHAETKTGNNDGTLMITLQERPWRVAEAVFFAAADAANLHDIKSPNLPRVRKL
jgi:hypothetical protein